MPNSHIKLQTCERGPFRHPLVMQARNSRVRAGMLKPFHQLLRESVVRVDSDDIIGEISCHRINNSCEIDDTDARNLEMILDVCEHSIDHATINSIVTNRLARKLGCRSCDRFTPMETARAELVHEERLKKFKG